MIQRTIIRLIRYKNSLLRFKKLGFVKVFSDNLADAIGVTPSQVRKDFSVFGISGNRRGGYKVDELLEQLKVILGKDKQQKIIIVGAGNIGLALMNYKGFEIENMRIIGAFDVDPSKSKLNTDITVYPISEMLGFIKKHCVEIGIIAVPDIAAQHVADLMISVGIKGILNFAPIRLKGKEDTVINNVNLALELENIIYFVNTRNKAEGCGHEDQDI